MALALLVSFQEQKQGQKQGQKHQYFARRHSLKTIENRSQKQKRNQSEKGQNFFVSLVDTRSVKPCIV